MTNETKKRGIGKTLFIALVALTLISCCFLGSTFARYTSGGNGSATTGVAKWSITDDATDSINVDFNKLSPSMENWDGTADRTNETGKVKVATITNAGDVSAKVTLSAPAESLTFAGTPSFGETGIGTDNVGTEDAAPSEYQVRQLFSIALYYVEGDVDEYSSGSPVSDAITLGTGDSITVFAEVTWTSMDTYYMNETVADAIDTWVGENITSISYQISYTAVQASEQPTA